MPKILSKPEDIRAWAEARMGNPMLMDIPGTVDRAPLQISFGQHALNADTNEGPDRPVGGYELVGWDDWMTELDRQDLALKVRDETPGRLDNDFEFVPRGGTETTEAAKKPAV